MMDPTRGTVALRAAAGFDPAATGRLAMAIPIVAILAMIALVLLYAGLPPFGPVNDLLNALGAAIVAVLAWRVLPLVRDRAPGVARALVAVAWIGSAAIIGNSVLVAAGQLDWMLGGLYTALGFGFHGIWLLGTVLLARGQPGTEALVAGRALALGIAAAVGLVLGLSAATSLAAGESLFANPVVYLSFLGWLLFAIWCWIVGRRLTSQG